MREASDAGSEEFVVEPMTDLAGTPVPAKKRFTLAHPPGRLGQAGLAGLAEGLALLGCFFFPWFSFPDPHFSGVSVSSRPVFLGYSGWDTAIGIAFNPPFRLAIFAHLWLIPVTALGLLVLVWFAARRHISRRLVTGITMALSMLSLFVELGFYMQVSSLEAEFEAAVVRAVQHVPYSLYNVSWGFGLAVCVNMAAIIACIYLLRSDETVCEGERMDG